MNEEFDIKKTLLLAAQEMRNENQSGWPNTCDMARERIAELEAMVTKLRRSNSALKGHVARMQEKIEAFETDGMCEF